MQICCLAISLRVPFSVFLASYTLQLYLTREENDWYIFMDGQVYLEQEFVLTYTEDQR